MRFTRPWVAVICLVLPMLTGCASSGTSLAMKSPSWWPWGKKTDPLGESALASAQPQLPSQTATPTMPSQGYGVPAGTGTTNPYGPPASSYATAPASYTPYTPPAAYSGSPGTGLYDTQTQTYPGYAAASPSASGGYPLSDPSQTAGANTTMQNQFYNPDYARPSTSDPYSYPSTPAANAPPAYPDYNAYSSTPSYPPAGAASVPSSPYGAPSSAGQTASAYTADARAGAYGAAPATSYPQVPDYGAAPSTPPAAAGYTADPSGFQPGNTGYAPANNGYQPQGYPHYESPAGPYQMPQGRSDAPYRPGGTSDYPRASKASPADDALSADNGLNVVAPASYNELMPETAPLHPIGGAAPAVAQPAQFPAQ